MALVFVCYQHAVGAMGGGQSLASPGSCLETFSSRPYVECTVTNGGQCHFFNDKFSFWLVSIKGVVPESTFHADVGSQTLKAGQLLQSVSRCRVCVLSTDTENP